MLEARKVPYQPSQTHRFAVSSDYYSQERFAAIGVATAEVIKQYPAYVDVVLLGSLAKGKVLVLETLKTTDIDLVYFLDSDRAVAAHPKLISEDARYREYVEMLSAWDPMGTDRQLALSVHTHRALDITEEVINSRLSKEHSIDYKTSTINALPIAVAGEDSIFQETQDKFWGAINWSHKQDRIEEVPIEMAHWISGVALFWGWDMNGNRRPYREAFFKDLEALGHNLKQENWKAVDNYVRFWERKYGIPPQLERFYPQSFEEAKEFYLNPAAFANSIKT